ncbi:MAG: hypothetical protein ACI892_001696 [Marinobacter maritimus]
MDHFINEFGITYLYKRKIVDHMQAKEDCDKIGLFNFSLYARSEVVNTQITIRAQEFNISDDAGKKLNTLLKINVKSIQVKLFTTLTTAPLWNLIFSLKLTYRQWALPLLILKRMKRVH